MGSATPLDKNTEKLDLRGVFVWLKSCFLSILSQNLKIVPRGTILFKLKPGIISGFKISINNHKLILIVAL